MGMEAATPHPPKPHSSPGVAWVLVIEGTDMQAHVQYTDHVSEKSARETCVTLLANIAPINLIKIF